MSTSSNYVQPQLLWLECPYAKFADDGSAHFSKNATGLVGPGKVAGKYGAHALIVPLTVHKRQNVAIDMDGSAVWACLRDMRATITRNGTRYKGQFLDGAKGKGLDITSGNVDGKSRCTPRFTAKTQWRDVGAYAQPK